ncbi:hypothetical protein OV079_12455 [Nannocystis pusilla]|uniref:Uncharacterized protein n=1 Tax=Nannocystis pusilla TaxID=889268 RepID=A0A9X3IXZ9_9BACT|nr:hypothetical protein [Nannocystis pusilla]MCY1006358.1 hypothetical protein [Nannocystis pusilla]
MAGTGDQVPGYRRPHEDTRPAAATDGPREALGRLELPVVGPLDLELALAAPLRLAVDAEVLEIDPGSALLARLPDLPTVELRRTRIDLVHGTVSADADAIGPFLFTAAGVALRIALRRGLGWHPGRSVVEFLTQNLPADPQSRARRLVHGPLGASAWLPTDARLVAELRGDRAEVALSRPAVLRVLGLALPILAVRLLFGPARLEIDPGPTGPVRRAMLRFAAWVASRWLRAPARRHDHPGLRPVRRRAAPRPPRRPRAPAPRPEAPAPGSRAPYHRSHRTGPPGHVCCDRSRWPCSWRHVRCDRSRSPWPGRPVLRASYGPARPPGRHRPARAARRSPAARRPGAGPDPPRRPRRAGRARRPRAPPHPGGRRGRFEAAGGLHVHVDELPELAELRLVRALLVASPPAAPGVEPRVRLEIQTDPPLGPLMRALIRRVVDARVIPRLSPALLARLGLVGAHDPDELVLLDQAFNLRTGVRLTTDADAEVRVRHAGDALVVEAPAGLRLRFHGLPVLPDADIHRLEYRWHDGSVVTEATPDLGEFGHLALAQLIRVRAAPVLPDILGVRRDGGPSVDPELEQQLPALLASVRVPVVGPLDVRFDPADVLAVRLAPDALRLTSARKLAIVAPELGLVVRLAAIDHDIAAVAVRADSDPPLGDWLSQLVARCVEQFGLARVRPHLPLAPQQLPEAPWLLAHVPKDTSKRVRLRAELPAGAGLRLERRPDALELRAEAPLQLVPEGTALLAEVAVHGLRWRPAVASLELLSDPPAGPLVHEILRRLFARFAPAEPLAELLRRLALPAAAPLPPPLPVPPGAVVWEQTVGAFGAVRVSADQARTVDLSLRRGGAHIAFGKGATVRVVGLGLHITVRTVDLTFLPWTLVIDASPPAGELGQHLLSHAMRALFAEFMRHFWPSDRSPRAGHDTLLAVGADKPWGPLKICVAKGGSIDLHLDHDGLALRSAAGLFVTGEALDWLPDFYLHDLSLRARDAAVKLAISGIAEEHYHEAAAVSPVTEAVLSHLYKVLAAPNLPAAWAQRLGLPRPPLPPAPPDDPSRIAVFSARLPGDYGEFALLMDPADTVTLTANEIEIAVESERGLSARMPGLRLAIQLRGARYHLQSGEVQVGGLGQLENALVEALVRRQIGDPADPGASGVRGVLDRFPADERGRLVLFHHPLVDVLLLPGTSVRLRLDDRGLKIGADPALVVDGPARLNFLVCGLRYSFGDARFSIDFEGDTVVADLFEKIVDARAEKRLNDQLLPLLPAAMRTPGYRLSTDPQVRANIAALIRSFARRKRTA